MDLFFVQHQVIIPIISGIFDFSISNFSLSIIGLTFFVYLFFVLSLINSKNNPHFFQNMVEFIYENIFNIFKSYLGKKGTKYIPFLFSLMVFIFAGNLGNLIPGIFAYTSQLIVTLTLGIMVFILVCAIGIYEHKSKFLNIFIPSKIPTVLKPFLFVLELFSFMMRPVSLALRLSINMIAGHIMLHVIASFGKDLGHFKFLAVLISSVLSIFEIGVAALQAYVFAVLSSIYIADIMKQQH